jgi:hypothetical protein
LGAATKREFPASVNRARLQDIEAGRVLAGDGVFRSVSLADDGDVGAGADHFRSVVLRYVPYFAMKPE